MISYDDIIEESPFILNNLISLLKTQQTDMGEAAYDVEQYSVEEIKRIAIVAFDMAMKRNKKVTSELL